MFLNYPSEVVFDEYHYGKFASAYLTRDPSFSGHPPLGEMMLAGAGWIFNIEPNCTFEEVGHPCSPYIFFALRFLPALFGVLSLMVFYAFIKILTKSKEIALIGGFLFVCENAILVQSRLILIDIFLIFFGILGLFLLLKAMDEKRIKIKWLFIILSGLSLGACLSVKWTGLGIIATAILLVMMKLSESKARLREWSKTGIVLGICVIFVYCLSFWVQFHITPNNNKVDNFWNQYGERFSPIQFRGDDFEQLSFPGKLARMNYIMFQSQESGDFSHPSSSRFYEWPFMETTITYWLEPTATTTADKPNVAAIGLVGNYVIWILSSIGMIMLVFSLLSKKIRDEFAISPFLIFFILFGYLFNLLPFILISRSTFLYHYFPSYVLTIVNLGIILDWIRKHNKKLFWIMILIIIGGFIASAPTTYGFQRYFNIF
ncbi:phospholipid carrier-dependent glycosyltransferase [Patescibacteria group bacterium]|nr:phospholipid carrier-dependent glycosyltransferase [Patescibacteria group bacterium]MBU4162269.1 phospholipid carrier-dependent glycosyltransferase [Patescibacteria group bacterium]